MGLDLSGRIINGNETQPHAFPSIVRMRMSKSRNAYCGIKANKHCGFCGGTIINSQWILTAGHCCYRRGNSKERALKVPLTILPQTVSFAIGAHYDDTCDYSHQCSNYTGVNGGVTGYVVNAAQIVIHPEFQAGTKIGEKGTFKYDFCLVKIKEDQTIKFDEDVKKVELPGTDFDLVIYYL